MRYLLGCMRYHVMCDMWCVGEMGVQIETNHFYCSDPNRRHRYQLRLCLRQKSPEQLVRKSAMCKEWSFSSCIPFNFFEPHAAVGCKIGRGTVCVINKILCHIGLHFYAFDSIHNQKYQGQARSARLHVCDIWWHKTGATMKKWRSV